VADPVETVKDPGKIFFRYSFPTVFYRDKNSILAGFFSPTARLKINGQSSSNPAMADGIVNQVYKYLSQPVGIPFDRNRPPCNLSRNLFFL
jgi:hypothetical protein